MVDMTQAERNQQYYELNRTEILAKRRQRYEASKDATRERKLAARATWTPEQLEANKKSERERIRALRATWTPEQRARNLELQHQWYLDNKSKHQTRMKARYTEHRQEILADASNRYYGMTDTIEKRAELFKGQDGKCAVCGKQLTLEKIKGSPVAQLDHDHKTKQLRGVLCHACNTGLGLFNDNPSLLRKAATYLESYDPIPQT